MTTSGTKEWANSNINYQYGCKNACKYCYAAKMAIRFKRFKNLDDWSNNNTLDFKKINQNYRKRKGRIMFPTSHDIYPENEKEAIHLLGKLLKAGNEVLITTKPRIETITNICNHFQEYRDLIQFRFTISSKDDKILKMWEPNAPGIDERIKSLQKAWMNGFKTSVSIEPYLDQDPQILIQEVEPYVNQSIWIGIMNTTMLPKEGRELYNKLNLKEIYSAKYLKGIMLKNWIKAGNNKLRLKDSVRNLVGKEFINKLYGINEETLCPNCDFSCTQAELDRNQNGFCDPCQRWSECISTPDYLCKYENDPCHYNCRECKEGKRFELDKSKTIEWKKNRIEELQNHIAKLESEIEELS